VISPQVGPGNARDALDQKADAFARHIVEKAEDLRSIVGEPVGLAPVVELAVDTHDPARQVKRCRVDAIAGRRGNFHQARHHRLNFGVGHGVAELDGPWADEPAWPEDDAEPFDASRCRLGRRLMLETLVLALKDTL